MVRWSAALLAALVLLGASLVPWATAATRLYLARVVRCSNASGGASLFSAGPRRAQVRIMNLGTATVATVTITTRLWVFLVGTIGRETM